MTDDPIACKHCQHRVFVRDSLSRCASPSAPRHFQCIDGFFSENSTPLCLQVNHDGKCVHFEANDD